uniref:Bis(monoacylglycero)phosphate synthase CLN5 n=1 Tax=Arion vulgaris TaxID=1028688 RepID=A0A0B6ZAU6_9EUPU
MFSIAFLLCPLLVFSLSSAIDWPQPHRKYDKRPNSNSYCQAGVIAFCPTGMQSNYMPTFNASDTLYVYAMKAPVWEFKFGSLLKYFNIMHDAIGFYHVQSGLNMTMEWYELFQLFNCTFPHEPDKNKLLWCNQGATCIYQGIDDQHWIENGTLVKVAEINGETFNQFAAWVELDNNTYPFYETWTIMEKPGGQVWFDPFDCASWVLRAFDTLSINGAKFNQSVHLNYTKIILYSEQPIYIGNSTSIYSDPSTLSALYNFYTYFQGSKSLAHVLENLLKYISWFIENDTFYLFYNDQYWKLPLVYPYIKLTYDETPLPSIVTSHDYV